MAKIVYDDWREEEFNQEDFISRYELEENYISKDDVEENYVTREKYDQKKRQAKEAFKQKDLAWRQAVENEKENLAQSLREEIWFTTRHGYIEIPEEIKSVKEKHPDLSWEEAYKLSDYHDPVAVNPNPWRERETDIEKKEYSMDELADLADTNPALYNDVASRIEKWEIKQI
jgi:hypothetical protein